MYNAILYLKTAEIVCTRIILNRYVLGTEDQSSPTGIRIFITTKLQNPVFSPPVFNNFSVFDFTLTTNGLEDKLLDIVISKERYMYSNIFSYILCRTS